MKLEKFRVTMFRSVSDSGWIDVEDITSLIGTNESGKTNILLPLWKLNPAEGGEINLQDDLPRELFHTLRNEKNKPVFIKAVYTLDNDEKNDLAALTGLEQNNFSTIEVSRDFDGKYYWQILDAISEPPISKEDIIKLLENYISVIGDVSESTDCGQANKKDILSALGSAKIIVDSLTGSLKDAVSTIKTNLSKVNIVAKETTSALKFASLIAEIDKIIKIFSLFPLNENSGIISYLHDKMPKYVYYSNYGNLDSQIYLPHVIQNFARTDLGAKDAARVRTLKTLFKFVKLDANEIMQLGIEPSSVPASEIEKYANQKKEREILLASASASFTKLFAEWWKQGDYRFEFQADGNFFRIWVSDAKRPEKIELESRSTGLQWFFSFYLVFLVESEQHHRNAILLLDEPGVTLHPLAQKDLFEFFEGLADKNQILYTTHSPFMVDSDHLERVRAVYIDKNGKTVVSADLRAAEKQLGDNQPKSIYPVHAALGLTVSDTLLVNCNPILVEGESDQLYLSALKNLLIASGKINPHKELIFVPTGGVKGIKVTASILSAPSGSKPYVVVDGDGPGQKVKNELLADFYSLEKDKVIDISKLSTIPKAEIEDIFPTQKFVEVATKVLPIQDDVEEELSDFIQPNIPICNQIEAYAKKWEIPLDKSWKVSLATLIKKDLLRKTPKVLKDTDAEYETIVKLFKTICD